MELHRNVRGRVWVTNDSLFTPISWDSTNEIVSMLTIIIADALLVSDKSNVPNHN